MATTKRTTKRGKPTDAPVDVKDELTMKLKLRDLESGQSRSCNLDEARTWDWNDPEVLRIVGGWQITSYDRLIFMLRLKAESGYEEVEILEVPRYMALAGG